MSLSLMFYFLLASIMVAALPGPAMMLTIQSAVAGGWQQGIKVTAGILLADVVLLLLVCIGLGEIMAASPRLVAVLNIAAALYLLYLGLRTLADARRFPGGLKVDTGRQVAAAKEGFFITLINPRTIIFLLAFLPQFVRDSAAIGPQGQLLVLSAWFVLAVAAVMAAYTFAAHAARKYLAAPLCRRLMSAGFGLVLVFIGVRSLIEAV